MRKFQMFLVGLCGSAVIAGALAGEAPASKAAEPGSRVQHSASGEVVVTLDADTQKRMHLQTVTLASAQVNQELRAFGRVMDSSALANGVAERNAAEAAAAASAAEVNRVRTLAGQNNASSRTLEAAEAAAARDRVQVEAAHLRLLSAWGSALAGRNDLAELVKSLASLEQALVEVDLPPGQSVPAELRAARIVALGQPEKYVMATVLGRAPFVDPQMQGRGFLLLVTNNAVGLAPGAAVTGFLDFGTESIAGVIVPRECLVRFNGLVWAYRQENETGFERVPVALDRLISGGWFVRQGLASGDKLVSVGAQQLLSEELKTESAE